eukprot:4016472-Ditylum_brightwellii.AAC.1
MNLGLYVILSADNDPCLAERIVPLCGSCEVHWVSVANRTTPSASYSEQEILVQTTVHLCGT